MCINAGHSDGRCHVRIIHRPYIIQMRHGSVALTTVAREDVQCSRIGLRCCWLLFVVAMQVSHAPAAIQLRQCPVLQWTRVCQKLAAQLMHSGSAAKPVMCVKRTQIYTIANLHNCPFEMVKCEVQFRKPTRIDTGSLNQICAEVHGRR